MTGAAPPLQTEGRRALAGMGLMVCGCMVYAVMGACFRLAMKEGLPVPLVPFARGVFTVLVMLPWLMRYGPNALATRRPWAHLGRCVAGSFAFLLTMLALLWLPLADAIAILHAKPLWALPLAFLLLGERIGWDRAIAAAVGFGGVLVIVGPGGPGGAIGLSAGTIAALGGGVAGAMVLVSVKTLSATEPPFRVVAWYAIASVLLWAPVCTFIWVMPSWRALLLLMVGSAAAIIGDLFASWAARRAPVGLLAPSNMCRSGGGADRPAGLRRGAGLAAVLGQPGDGGGDPLSGPAGASSGLRPALPACHAATRPNPRQNRPEGPGKAAGGR